MGPLQGFTIIEMAGIGPGPMCAMLMAQLGASVIRIDRPPSAAEDFPLAIENDPTLNRAESEGSASSRHPA